MAINKKSFLIYCDTLHTVSNLTDDEAGRLFKHLLEYVNDLNPQPIDRLTGLLFEPIKQNLKRDLKKWDEISSKRASYGQSGGLAKASKSKQKLAKLPVNVNDNVNDNVINIRDNKQTLFKNSIYFDRIKFKEAFPEWSTEKLKHYYDSALDWSDSKGKLMKDWKATIRGWARRDANDGKEFDKPKPKQSSGLQFAGL